MKDKLNFYINGKWTESDSKERIEIINPANEELIGHVTSGTKDDINKAVSAASDAFEIYQFEEELFFCHTFIHCSLKSIKSSFSTSHK